MQTTAVQNKNSNKNDGNFKKVARAAAITGGTTTLAAGADLFITKGKTISGLTRGKISFIKTMSQEIDNVIKQDSYATKSRLEAFLCTPGLQAIWNHRIAHKLDEWKVPVLPRLISNISRILTGIEIHPGAKIGKNVFIDHTGAIIGQTATVKDGATLIGRVTLATNGTGRDGFYRHPTVERNATVGMNATVMGGKTVVGENAIVGASAVVSRSIPNGATVINNSRPTVIRLNGEKIEPPVLLKDFKE